MKAEVKYSTEGNVYYERSPVLFMKLVQLISDYPFSYGQMLRAKGKKSYIEKHPDYIPPYRDILDWLNTSLPLLSDPFYNIATKCHWILNGITDFPTCAYSGCGRKFIRNNVEVNGSYPHFCLDHSKCDPSTIEKRKASCRLHFGTDFPMQSDAVKEKAARTNTENIGYATPLASPKHRKIGRQTKLELYGDENYHNSEQASKTYHEHAKDPDFLTSIRQRIEETNVRNGHSKNWTNREKSSRTRRENHGGEYWTNEMTDKANATVSRHRLENPNYDAERREKTEKSVFESLGVKCALQSDEAKKHLQEWIDQHGGGTNPFQTDCAKEKSRRSMNDRYGVDYALQSPKIKAKYDFKSIHAKGQETKRRNGTFNTSKPEENAYSMLCSKFGKDDVERQYKSEKYPFRCDFYVRSIDAYIECNYHWTHGGHWFDPASAEDMSRLEAWKSKGTAFYDIAVRVWTEYDVMKRKTAKRNRINYLVFWKQSELVEFLGS